MEKLKIIYHLQLAQMEIGNILGKIRQSDYNQRELNYSLQKIFSQMNSVFDKEQTSDLRAEEYVRTRS